MPTVVKQRSWPVAVLAAGLLAGLLVAGGWQAVADQPATGEPTDEVDDAGPDREPPEPGTSSDDVADERIGASLADGRVDDDPATSNDCQALAVAAALRATGPESDAARPPSTYELAARSPTAVRGRLVSTTATGGGTLIELEAAEVNGTPAGAQPPRIEIWTAGGQPLTEPLAEPLAEVIDVVAYLTGETVEGAAVVHPGGLWLGCGATTPAAPVSAPTSAAATAERSWPTRPSLDDLWRVHRAATAPPAAAISPTVDGPVAIYDLRTGGDRLRVTVPAGVARDIALVDDDDTGPAWFIGDGLSIQVAFSPCTVRAVAADVHWALSARMVEDGRLVDDVVRLCRPAELLSMTVDAAGLDTFVATERAGWLDGFTIQPVEVGARYGAVLAADRPELATCSACSPWGPFDYPDLGVTVARTAPDAVAAFGQADLVERWAFTTAGDVSLRPLAGAALLDVAGGPLIALEPGSGSPRWQVDRLPGELGEGIAEHPGGALAWSSFASPDDDRPPRLRWLDVGSGDLRWESVGREGADWQRDEPVVVAGVVIVMDVLDAEASGSTRTGSQLLAFDTGDGRLRWAVDVGSPAGARSGHVLELLDGPSGPVVVARTTDGALFRVDPATGDELWRTRLDADRIDGTAQAEDGTVGLVARTVFGLRVVDLDNGRLLDR